MPLSINQCLAGIASLVFSLIFFSDLAIAAGIDVSRQYRLHNSIFGPTRSLDCSNQQLSIAGSGFTKAQNWRIVPAPDGSPLYRITNELLGADSSLTVRPGTQPAMEKTDASSIYQLWSITPIAGGNTYRITRSLNGVNWGLAVAGTSAPLLTLVPQADVNDQQWVLDEQNFVPIAAIVGRWAEYTPSSNAPNGAFVTVGADQSVARLENGKANNFGTILATPKRFTIVHENGTTETFTYQAAGTIIRFLQQNGAPANFYWKQVPNIVVGSDSKPKLVSTSEPVPNPPLEPANIEFGNSHGKELLLYIRDMKNDPGSRYVKIPVGKSQVVKLARDAGAKVVDTWWVPKPSGEVREEKQERQLPVPVRYRISVYEKHLMSSEIDATKKKKNRPRVDRYQPRSIGVFELPPGAELEDASIDAYRLAKRANNTGAVDYVDPNAWK